MVVFWSPFTHTRGMNNLRIRRFMPYILLCIGGMLLLVCIASLVLYMMPHRSTNLQHTDTRTLSYKQAVAAADKTSAADKKLSDFDKGCESQLYTHGKKVARSVVMFHGVTACPKQYDEIAKTFYNAGYNVYVPLAPQHGTTNNPEATADLTLAELTSYVGESYSVAAGLGDSVGFVGQSGGAALATWGAQYIDGVSRLLVISPFYEISQDASPRWQKPLLLSLYGMNIAPDRIVQGFSARALAKYLILVENYREDLTTKNLEHVAVVTSANDTQIDLDVAHYIPKTLAKNSKASFQQTRLAPELGIGHDALSPSADGVKKHQAQLNNLYLSFYENREPAKEL